MDNQLFDRQTYFALALDPLHVGTGGARLGRVDMSIVREPGTNVPKIPGTSIVGACRTYAAMRENRYRWEADGKTYVCAGQGQEDEKKKMAGHCGKPDCPICMTFGYSKGQGGSFQGLAQFSDARLVLFPVHSLAGPVWVTCADVLGDWGLGDAVIGDAAQVRVANGVQVKTNKLNLGWLMLDVDTQNPFSLDGKLNDVPQEIRDRAVLVSNKLFSQIVNDNLEVRTSVSIDPQTGAASEGALFTYEALPRASVLAFEVVVSDPKFYRVNGAPPLSSNIETVKQTARKGLELFDALGVGGMNTRGMGRMKVLGLNEGGAQ
jgi:CRISPR-associated protein Cmr4